MICTPVEPVPITPIRLSGNDTEWSQRDEWNVGPANESRPGMSG